MKILAFAILLLTLTCCYKMPDEYDYSTIPLTNNPHITKEKPSSPLPSMNY